MPEWSKRALQQILNEAGVRLVPAQIRQDPTWQHDTNANNRNSQQQSYPQTGVGSLREQPLSSEEMPHGSPRRQAAMLDDLLSQLMEEDMTENTHAAYATVNELDEGDHTPAGTSQPNGPNASTQQNGHNANTQPNGQSASTQPSGQNFVQVKTHSSRPSLGLG